MCYRNSWDMELGDMSKEAIDKIASECDQSVGIVMGGIGEPSIAENIIYAVKKFKDHPLEITTNGVMDEKTIDFVCRYFKNVIISVDGTEEAYFHIRKTDFEHVLKTLDKIQAYKKQTGSSVPTIEFAFVLTKKNKDSIYNVIKTASKYDVKRILMSHLMPQNQAQTKDIFYDEHFNEEGRAYIQKVNNFAYFQNRVVVSFPFMEIKTDRLCYFVDNDYTYVDVTGDVVPCYRFSSNYKEYVFGREKNIKKHSFGNIMEQTLPDIYNSDTYKDFRHAVRYALHPSCVDCEYRDGCDYVKTANYDCSGYSPSCADCLWNRKIIRCT